MTVPAIHNHETVVLFPEDKNTIIQQKLLGSTAEQIEALATKLAEKVLNSLGPKKKAQFLLRLPEGKAKADPFARMMQSLTATYGARQQGHCLPDEQAARFLLRLIPFFRNSLTQYFANPDRLLQEGWSERLTDEQSEPTGYLKEALEKIGVTLTIMDCLPFWELQVRIDQEKSKIGSKMTFIVQQTSDEKEFDSFFLTL